MNAAKSHRHPLGALALVFLGLLSACGGGSDSSGTASNELPEAIEAEGSEGGDLPADARRDSIDEPRAGASATQARETAQAVGVATPKVAVVAWRNYRTAAQQDHVARFNLAVLALPQTSTPASVVSSVAALKNRNPSLQVAQMTYLNQVADSFLPLATPVSANNWWLRNAAGSRIVRRASTELFDTNFTTFAPADANAMRFPQIKAGFDSTAFFAATPAIDFVFANLVKPQAVVADWRRAGANQPWTDAAVQAAQRSGHAAYWDALRQQHPNLKVIANTSTAWQTSEEFVGKTQGAYLDSMIGRSWSIDTRQGWPAMMAAYRTAMAHTVAPKAVIFNMAAAADDFRAMRFGLASALLDDGYFSLTVTSGAQPAPWIDEFSAPIGTAAEPPPTVATPSGIWSRSYSHGLVLVNPSSSASATIAVPAGYTRLLGSQAPSVNNGQAVSGSVTLAPRDGLLLIKSDVVSDPDDTQAPTPPGNLVTSALTCQSVTLSWSTSTDNTAVTGYDIYHDGQFMRSVGGSTLSSPLTLTPGAIWGLYVNARDAAGNVSQASPILTIKIPLCVGDTQPPSTPSGLGGSVTGTTVFLNWTASTDNVAVVGYDVFRNNVKVGSTSALSYSDSGLAPNTAYQYTLAARDAADNSSARSVGLSLTTDAVCANVVCAVNEVATDHDIPWGLAALPDGSVLYSRRDVLDIVRLDPATGVKTSLGTLPNAQGTDAEGGMMGIAVSRNFPTTDPWLYVFYSTATDNRIVRVQYRNSALDRSTLQVLLSGIGRNAYHNGGRLRYGPDGKLYAATGDAQRASSAQDLNALTGKILRLNPDGSVPSDNPYGNYVWSYGHRNPQGLAFDAQGRLWQQEFGNSLMDETNLIQKGGNYGWPNCEGTAFKAGSGCATPGYIAPKQTYLTSEGSCSGIAVVQGALYVACQRGARVYRATISGTELGNLQQLFVGAYGRIRTVEPSIDGGLWMSTTNRGDKDSVANNSNNRIFKVTLGR